MPEIVPEFVTYANDLVEKVGARFELSLRSAVADLATKSDLNLLSERIETEKTARLELEAELKADENARLSKSRWFLGSIFGLAGIVIGDIVTHFLPLIH